MSYAADTGVPVERSKQQIEALLRQRGCEGFASAWHKSGHQIEFVWKGMRIRFTLPGIDEKAHAFDRQGRPRNETHKMNAIQQADRSRWRGLFLVVKAKLEAVESGISIFEEEFLAFIVDPATNMTVGEHLVPQIQSGGQLMLGDGKKGARRG